MIAIDYHSRQPIYEQIEAAIKALIMQGAYKAGSQLPSVRALSLELGINPNTIRHAYSRLEAQGVIKTLPARGCFVSEDTQGVAAEHKKKLLAELYPIFSELRKLGTEFSEIEELYKKA